MSVRWEAAWWVCVFSGLSGLIFSEYSKYCFEIRNVALVGISTSLWMFRKSSSFHLMIRLWWTCSFPLRLVFLASQNISVSKYRRESDLHDGNCLLQLWDYCIFHCNLWLTSTCVFQLVRDIRPWSYTEVQILRAETWHDGIQLCISVELQ